MCLLCRLSSVGGSAPFVEGVMTPGPAGREGRPAGTSGSGEVDAGDM